MVDINFNSLVTALQEALKRTVGDAKVMDDLDPVKWAIYVEEKSCGPETQIKEKEKYLKVMNTKEKKYAFAPNLERISVLLKQNLDADNIKIEKFNKSDNFSLIGEMEEKRIDSEEKIAQLGKEDIKINQPALKSPAFYRLITSCLYPYVALPLYIPLDFKHSPWRDRFLKQQPIMNAEKTHVWGFRGDSRGPNVIFKESFTPKFKDKLENDECRKAISEELHLLENRLVENKDEKKIDPEVKAQKFRPVWFRYKEEDLCTETSIAIAPDLASAAVFPFIYPPKDDVKIKTYCVSRPRLIFHEKTATTGRSKPTIFSPTCEPSTSYVYGLRMEKERICDTAYIQKTCSRNAPYPEMASEKVLPKNVQFAIQLRRWPIDRYEGWAVLDSVWVRGTNKVWPKAAVDDKIVNLVGEYKDKVLHYKWTAALASLCICDGVRKCKICDDNLKEQEKLAKEEQKKAARLKDATKKKELFECPNCGKSFPKSMLKIHLNVCKPKKAAEAFEQKYSPQDLERTSADNSDADTEEIALNSSPPPPPPPPPPPMDTKP